MQSNQEYDQKKRECWEEFIDEAQSKILGRYEIFCAVFDRAYALSKQEKDADTVIQGWVARDQSGYHVLHYKKPHRTYGNTRWYSAQSQKSLPRDSFPSVTWQSEPKKVRIELTLIDE